ncbi:unnamed protein product [Sympodiomycopsis kandeliae]
MQVVKRRYSTITYSPSRKGIEYPAEMLHTPYAQSPLAGRASLPRQHSSPHLHPATAPSAPQQQPQPQQIPSGPPAPPPQPEYYQYLPQGAVTAVAGPSQRNRRTRHTQDYSEPSYLRPPSPTSRLLLALLSPTKSEVSWALSRLIHASFFHPEHLILSQWCGLAQRLLDLVHRFNSAARGQGPLGWDELEQFQQRKANRGSDSEDSEDSEDEDEDDHLAVIRSGSTTSRRRFDARTNEDHYFILNAAVSASLILRNTCEQQENALWLTGQPELLKVAYEAISLPEDLFGFEDNVRENIPRAYHNEEDMQFEGVREMRLYWVEILRTVAHRMKLFNPTDVVRLDDGTVTRSPSAATQTAAAISAATGSNTAASTTPATTTAALPASDIPNGNAALPAAGLASEPAPSRIHSSDQIYTHSLLLLHSTSDQALLLAILRFLAQLISNAKARPELFVEQLVRFRQTNGTSEEGHSPGVVSRCRELLPLASFSHPLAESILDCLDASVDVSVETSDSPAETIQQPEADVKFRRIYPNALNVISLRSGQAGPDGAQAPSQPVIPLLAHMLELSATFWDRAEPANLHPHLHPHRLIPSQARHRQETFRHVPWLREEDANWHRLRASKEADGLVHYATEKEKREIESLEEPARLDAFLKLTTRTVGDGHRQENNHYITQMHIWTSYRDTFDSLIKKATAQGRTVPPLMAAADVISRVTALFPTCSAVLVNDDDRRQPPNTQKFVIRGLEGYRRPEVIKWNCRWQGCPAPNTDSPDALMQHVALHVQHGKEVGKCQWSTCMHKIHVPDDPTVDVKDYLIKHVKTHLPDLDQDKKVNGAEDGGAKESQDVKPPVLPKRGLSPPPRGRYVHVRPFESATTGKEDVDSAQTPRGNDHPHAKSASHPSPYTFDRPSSIKYRVYRTPFDQERQVPEGPAYASAKILKRIAEMCRDTLGEDDGSNIDEEDLTQDSSSKKRLKLDFSDRFEQNRFGSPFTLPENFEKFHTEQQKLQMKIGTPQQPSTTSTSLNSPQQQKIVNVDSDQELSTRAIAKLKSTQALTELLSVEEHLVKWAGCNDILCTTLMETMDSLHRTRGIRIGSIKRKKSAASKDIVM